MTTEEINDFREKLPRGWLAWVTKDSGCERSTVWKVLHGRSQNTKVLDSAIRFMEEKQLRETKIRQIINA